jgi:cardiolipin synthase
MAWMGGGTGSIDTALSDLVNSARHELIILAYAMSDGASDLLELIRQRLSAGVRVTMVVDRMADQHGQVPERLCQLAAGYGSLFRLYDFAGADQHAHLHAKVVVADRARALVGSANLSWHGLVTNHELGVLVEGPSVSELALATDRLLTHRFVRRVSP